MGCRGQVEMHKLALVFLAMILAAFSNWTALAFIHDYAGREALPDAVFSVIPEQSWALKVGDLMVILCSVSFFFLLFMHTARLIIIQRTAFIVGCLYTMRTIVLLCTQLPSGYTDSYRQCGAQMNVSRKNWTVIVYRVLSQAYKLGFQDMDDSMLCGDLLFSGHTLAMVVSTLTIAYYLPDRLKILRYLPFTFTWIGMICMVISRTHYTIDVIVAYWLSTGVFSIYHAFCETDTANRRQSVLYRLWMTRIIFWLEYNIPSGRIECNLKVPLILRFSSWRTKTPAQNENCQQISTNTSTLSI